jgi:T3SS negative regulator,GrlR
MKNGLYSVHIQMGDGVRGRASGVIVLRDGVILGGDPYFWSIGSYTVGKGTWKGDLVTNQHTPYRNSDTRPVFGGREVTTGFSGTYRDGDSEVFGTSLVGSRSVSFRATLRRLADI